MEDQNISRRLMLKNVGVGIGTGVIGFEATASATAQGGFCKEYRVPVALEPGLPKKYEIAGTLCLPSKGQQKSVIQMLVHGITYARYYWNFPYRPEKYSYVKFMTEEGYPTFNIDRIGSGKSSHPLPERIDPRTNAYIIHQLVQALRKGQIGNSAFQEVTLVGHSYGSYSSMVAQSIYRSADSLVLTGFNQQYGRGRVLFSALPLYPAALDDDEDINDLPLGYLTTRPGTRGDTFYYKPNTEAEVIAIDDRNKQTVTDAEYGLFPTEIPRSLNIAVPVLEVVGDQDGLFCLTSCSQDGSTELESTFWPAAKSFTIELVPNAGHNLNLHRNAQRTYSIIRDWSDKHTGK